MKKTMLRDLLLALSMMVCTHVARAALPEDLSVSLRSAVEELRSGELIFEIISRLYDQETQSKKKRCIEHFVRKLVNPETNPIANIMIYYHNLTYIRTGRPPNVDSLEWGSMFRDALTQYEATSRAHYGCHFNILSQTHLDFVSDGHCTGLSLLKILVSGNTKNTIDYAKYAGAKEPPFEMLLNELPHLSADWLDSTYKALVSGLRPKSTQERVDRIIFRSLGRVLILVGAA